MESDGPSGCTGVTIREWCLAGMKYADPMQTLKTARTPCSDLERERVAHV